MNRLAIMDHNFKVMMNKRFLSQPKKEQSTFDSKINQAQSESIEKTKVNRIYKPRNKTDINLIKFSNTKNVDFLLGKPAEVSRPQKTKRNKDIPSKLEMDKQSSTSNLLREIEKQFQSPPSTPKNNSEIGELKEEVTDSQKVIEIPYGKREVPLEEERRISSKDSMKPAKVVFKKAINDVPREERANRMAHFEYIESGLANTNEDPKIKIDHKFRMNNRLYTVMNKKYHSRAISENPPKSVVMHPAAPMNMNKFSPKRFRRFPRFTIFLNKDQENSYEKENSISLNPQFLNFLMTPERAEIVDKGKISIFIFIIATAEFDEALKSLNSQNLK
jgi:hypothetical protein